MKLLFEKFLILLLFHRVCVCLCDSLSPHFLSHSFSSSSHPFSKTMLSIFFSSYLKIRFSIAKLPPEYRRRVIANIFHNGQKTVCFYCHNNTHLIFFFLVRDKKTPRYYYFVCFFAFSMFFSTSLETISQNPLPCYFKVSQFSLSDQTIIKYTNRI